MESEERVVALRRRLPERLARAQRAHADERDAT